MDSEELQTKYLELLSLRLEREALETRGILQLDGAEGRARKARCRRLAGEFPGCLRELEVLNSDALKRRLEKVRVDRDFADFIRRYHALGRWMAALKRWQGEFRRARGRRPSVKEARERWRMDFLDDVELASWLFPADGRVHDQVWKKLADERQETVKKCRVRFFSGHD